MSIFKGIVSLAQSSAKAIQSATQTVTPIGTTAYGTGASVGRGVTAISTGRISNAGLKAGVGIGATGAGVGVLGLGAQQVIEPLTQITQPLDTLLGKGTGWLLIIGTVILLIIGVLFKR